MNAVDIVRTLYDFYAQGDIKSGLQYYADDICYKWPVDDRYSRFSGCTGNRDAFEQRLNDLRDRFEYHSFTPVAIFGSGDRVAAQIKFDMTHRASGERLQLESAHFWTIRDGKATELIEFYDTALIAESERLAQERAAGV